MKLILGVVLSMVLMISIGAAYAEDREFTYDQIFQDNFLEKIIYLLSHKILHLNGEADPISTLEEIKKSYDDGFNKGVASSTIRQIEVVASKDNDFALNKVIEQGNIIDELEVSLSQKDYEISVLNTALEESTARNSKCGVGTIFDEFSSTCVLNTVSKENQISKLNQEVTNLQTKLEQKDYEISSLATALEESNKRNSDLLKELETEPITEPAPIKESVLETEPKVIFHELPFNFSSIDGIRCNIVLLGFEETDLVRDGLIHYSAKYEYTNSGTKSFSGSCQLGDEQISGWTYPYGDVSIIQVNLLYHDESKTKIIKLKSSCHKVEGDYIVKIKPNETIPCELQSFVKIDPDKTIDKIELKLNDNRKRPNEQRFYEYLEFKIIE